MIKKYGNYLIEYLGMEEEISQQNCNYVIANAYPDNHMRIDVLRKLGYEFLDRTVLAEIPISDDDTRERMIRYHVIVSDNKAAYSSDVYDLAKEAFVFDRRFHLDKDFSDESLAEAMIYGYLNEFCDSGYRIIKCIHKEKLIGFIIIKDISDGLCENMLGAVHPLYQSRGAAISLYNGMMKILRQKNYRTVYGRISTKNTASLNLHMSLGKIRFSEPEDIYVLRRNI